ncbi:MAG TPA: phosphatidylinositol mannoside acyltransferase [Mycobacteriales bacterium]|nr:phosphatidylinositol mannoside acyltransferase [Mycobacteriales bacterium]
MSRATGLAYRAAWGALKRTPELPSRMVFSSAAALLSFRGGKGVERLRSNLARMTGANGVELDRLTHAGMQSYARYWYEVFRLPVMDPATVAAQHDFAGLERLRRELAKGRGAILALTHSGNWDAAGMWLVQQGVPFTTVAERLEPADLFRQFVEFRQSIGMEVLPTGGQPEPGERPVLEVLEERLRAGGCLCLLADRDMSKAGVPVRFGPGVSSMPAGPALLAIRTGCAILPTPLWYPPDGSRGWCGEIQEPLPIPTQGTEQERVAKVTQLLADVFAANVQAHPEDWHMLARFWRDDLEPAVRQG